MSKGNNVDSLEQEMRHSPQDYDRSTICTNTNLRLMSYLDEVSSVSLQMYSVLLFDKLRLANSSPAIELTEVWLSENLRLEWNSSYEARSHWEYVINPVPIDPSNNGEYVGRDVGRSGWTLDDFMNDQMVQECMLTRVEVLSLRLYTGKGYYLINSNCRDSNDKFAVTSFLINRAVGKMAETIYSKNNPTNMIYYRGMSGRLRLPFVSSYSKENIKQSTLGMLSDCAPFSTTSNISVATGAYGGELLFVISKCDKVMKEGSIIDGNYRIMCTPAPVRWVSQFPGEEEYLWPTNTSLIPKVADHRIGLPLGLNFPNKEIYEFTPTYLWDINNKCIGRYKNIDADELDMARMTLKLASKGIGMQDAHLSIQQLLVEKLIDDDDLDLEQVISISFCVFDRNAVGLLYLNEIEELMNYFYLEVLSFDNTRATCTIQPVVQELKLLVKPSDNAIHYCDYSAYYISCARIASPTPGST